MTMTWHISGVLVDAQLQDLHKECKISGSAKSGGWLARILQQLASASLASPTIQGSPTFVTLTLTTNPGCPSDDSKSFQLKEVLDFTSPNLLIPFYLRHHLMKWPLSVRRSTKFSDFSQNFPGAHCICF